MEFLPNLLISVLSVLILICLFLLLVFLLIVIFVYGFSSYISALKYRKKFFASVEFLCSHDEYWKGDKLYLLCIKDD